MELNQFIHQAVINDYKFPPFMVGGNAPSIQEIMHNYSIASIERYSDMLEAQAPRVSRTEKRLGKTEKKINGTNITYTEFVDILDQIIAHKINRQREEEKADEIALINQQLKDLDESTPEGKRAALQQRLAILTAKTEVAATALPPDINSGN